MNKIFAIKAEELKQILANTSEGIASDYIMIQGHKIHYMYREDKMNDTDSGWRFFSGLETQEYADDANNFAIYKLNTIANYDSDIIPYLNLKIGSLLERLNETDDFEIIEDKDFFASLRI